MEGELINNIFVWIGFRVDWTLRIDSSAAKAFIQREGVGKVMHLDTRALWIEAEFKNNGLLVAKEDGKVNRADLGTKPHDVSDHMRLCEAVGLRESIDDTRPQVGTDGVIHGRIPEP